ncbi:MAG: O-succinylbenzoic acid (OSB) synthetase [Candidatus Woesebacteria bacterium GW2011_GWB1_39_10]|uniref:o-succinylbenzoate synthase n=3 Tax=Candidatus Woeseibacteriota TaxID=1752722 RepID=A0A0G0X7J6_9BACT|nr:MAG: O-succinylbenzoic acid (OSB) synthetase [Candidatus Woesebacteria bacterium GW2011_GWB1_39_10]KKR92615.1 MAG: O-succinylbenzoic acid (OSB) synthetase [Candidatus Woesebacteria bacterium GW2011_GWA1_41_13b]
MSPSSKPIVIKKIEVRLLRLPLITTFTTGFGTINYKETVVVRLEDSDGVVGWGEGAALSFPNYSPETAITTYLGLKEYLLPSIVGKRISGPEGLDNLYSQVKGYHFAKTAIDCAMWMICSIKSQQSLKQLLGGKSESVAIGESIGIKNSIDETLEEISLRLDQGYQRIKIKIKPGWDVELVRKVRAKFSDIPLMVDANSSYSLNDVPIFKKLDKFNLMMIEQPLGDTDIVDHSFLQKEITTPICLDESILSVEDARKAIKIGACKIINIKPGRVGGISESKKIHDFCQDNNIGVWCGGLLETGIGRAFNIALSSLPGFKYPADMSPSSFFYKEDLIDPTYEVDKNGYIAIPTATGLGYNLEMKRINKYTKQKYNTRAY